MAYEYDGDGLLTKKTDALNHWMAYTHNEDFLVTGVTYQNTINGEETPKYIKNAYTYNTLGNLTDIEAFLSTDGENYTTLGAKTEYVYPTPNPGVNDNYINKPLQVKAKKDAGTWATTVYTYNTYGDMLTATDAKRKDDRQYIQHRRKPG